MDYELTGVKVQVKYPKGFSMKSCPKGLETCTGLMLFSQHLFILNSRFLGKVLRLWDMLCLGSLELMDLWI